MVSKAAAVSLEDPPTGGEGGALQEQLTQEVFERAAAQATMEFASLQAQLEGLKPAWLENLRAEHDYAAESQLEAMLALKMQEVGSAIPLRRTAERKFRDELDLVDQSLEDVADIVRALQAKEAEDPSGQVDLRQATALAHTLESTRLPDLEAAYREANEAWFKPGKDPIVALFVGVTRKIARDASMPKWAKSVEDKLNKLSDHLEKEGKTMPVKDLPSKRK
ncbi:hypothetical protein TCAL_14618 [Tigriopus californicus]|uniref:Uncharacterized protein n=1 Tax=Tigriopus californicus TaxID=6832 RepID=A0A553PB72_TIGCA|nr:hypothetical protein TCAL_14618 [Tigriopus californicus]